jgi:uncharacterized protein (TIGR02246 family)
MYRLRLMLILLAASSFGCQSPNQASETPNAEAAKATIIALNQQWVVAFKARDATALARLFTADSVRLPDGRASAAGRQAIEAQYREEFAGLWDTEFDASVATEEVVVSGQYAFARGTDTLTEKKGDRMVQTTGKWMATYRQEPDASWKYLWSTYNTNQ